MRVVRADSALIAKIATVSGRARTCACGKPALHLCDWRFPGRGTCDVYVCDECVSHPAQGKDLCKLHAHMWEERCHGRKSA